MNGILTSDLIMIYLASTSSIEAGTATTLLLRDDLKTRILIILLL
jgi:hypothetical protein